ncbi:MAG: CYTH domain-containing protein [Chloroflexi bacterium]|nr:CYTH domain-containing protein [Chloroflexota bacterium]
MGTEIERKFLVVGNGWRETEGKLYRQGYLNSAKERVVRVRVVGEKGYLTIKGVNVGAVRAEFEYEIPVEEANEMLNSLCEWPIVEKQRHIVEFGGFTWEVDAFADENEGLVVAEIELESEDQSFDKPDWIGEEVTDDPRYYNVNLVKRPFQTW